MWAAYNPCLSCLPAAGSLTLGKLASTSSGCMGCIVMRCVLSNARSLSYHAHVPARLRTRIKHRSLQLLLDEAANLKSKSFHMRLFLALTAVVRALTLSDTLRRSGRGTPSVSPLHCRKAAG
jgi:hypothetical protein